MLVSLKKINFEESSICDGDFVVIIQSTDSKVLCRHEDGSLVWDQESYSIIEQIQNYCENRRQILERNDPNDKKTKKMQRSFSLSEILSEIAQKKITQSIFQIIHMNNVPRSESELKINYQSQNQSESNPFERTQSKQQLNTFRSPILMNENFLLRFSPSSWINFAHMKNDPIFERDGEVILFSTAIENNLNLDKLFWISKNLAEEVEIEELKFSFQLPSLNDQDQIQENKVEGVNQNDKYQNDNETLKNKETSQIGDENDIKNQETIRNDIEQIQTPSTIEMDIIFGPGKLGISMSPHQGMEIFGGMFVPVVNRITPDSQAVSNGIQIGDVIRSVNSQDFRNISLDSKTKWQSFINTILSESQQQKQVVLTILRATDQSIKLFNLTPEKIPERKHQESGSQPQTKDSVQGNGQSSVILKREEIPNPSVTPEEIMNENKTQQTNIQNKILDTKISETKSYDLISNLADQLIFESQAQFDSFLSSNPSRIILRHDTIMIFTKSKPSRFSLSKKNKYSWELRNIILCDDVLLVTLPRADNKFTVEAVVWLLNSKIDLRDVVEIESKDQKPTSHSCKIISPHYKENEGVIMLKWENNDDKIEWTQHLIQSLKNTIKSTPLGNINGWQHQVILGTIHTFVLNNDVSGFEDYLMSINRKEENKLPSNSKDSDPNCQQNLIESLNMKDDDGFTPLHYAASNKEALRMLLKLLSIGANPFIEDNDGMLPIHHASCQLNRQAIETLLSIQNMDVNVRDKLGRTPFYLVVHGVNYPSQSVDENYINAFSSCLAILKLHNADFDIKDDEEFSVLHRLIQQGNSSKMNTLLPYDIDIFRTVTNDHLTLLHFAVHPKFVQNIDPIIIQTLLKFGIQPNRRDISGNTPLHWLALTPDANWQANPKLLAALKVLLDFGARADIEDLNGVTPRQILHGKNIYFNLDESMKGWKESKQQRMSAVYNYCNLNKNSVWKGAKLENPDPTRCYVCEEKFPFFIGKHTCRLCGALVCHNCSGDCKICDGCFSRKYNDLVTNSQQTKQNTYANHFDDSSQLKQNDSKKKHEMKRNELFQGVTPSAAKSELGTTEIHSIKTSTSEVKNVMQQNVDQLMLRGEKLKSLETKTADMANAAKEFERICRELNNQPQKSTWF